MREHSEQQGSEQSVPRVVSGKRGFAERLRGVRLRVVCSEPSRFEGFQCEWEEVDTLEGLCMNYDKVNIKCEECDGKGFKKTLILVLDHDSPKLGWCKLSPFSYVKIFRKRVLAEVRTKPVFVAAWCMSCDSSGYVTKDIWHGEK
jgi:hypothetical protein